MENTSDNRTDRAGMEPADHLCVGLVAHVDAGKTTLAEGILYTTGQIRKLGRVDHRDAFLDTDGKGPGDHHFFQAGGDGHRG